MAKDEERLHDPSREQMLINILMMDYNTTTK